MIGQFGTEHKQGVLELICISDKYTMNLKNSEIIMSNSSRCVLAINEYGEAWIWTLKSAPVKLNDLDKINGKAIKEVAVTNNSSGKYAVLTEEGFVYTTSDMQNVSRKNEPEILSSYGRGPWKKQFILLKDSEY